MSATLARFSSSQFWPKELDDDAMGAVVREAVHLSMRFAGVVSRLKRHLSERPTDEERVYIQALYDHEPEEDRCYECGQMVPIDWAHEEKMQKMYWEILER